MTPLTTARHPSISEELDNMPHTIEAATHGHLGTEPGNHRQVSTSKQERVGSRLLAMTAVLSVDTFLGKPLYLKWYNVSSRYLHDNIIAHQQLKWFLQSCPRSSSRSAWTCHRQIYLFRGTFLLMSYRRAVVSHCPISMCEKNVVAQTRTGVFLASLNIAGVGSSRYDIDIMAISWECALYNRTRRSVYSAIITVAYVSAIWRDVWTSNTSASSDALPNCS